MTKFSIIIMMCEAEQGQDKDGIEHYLRALRKKVEHQVRNPFDLAFANYTFEELATWKNNVLQLDATSRLYGQRVDFLHCGALQIMGSVLNNEQAVQDSTEQRQEIKREKAYDNAPYEKHLQQPQRISCEIEHCETSFMLWRQICKKRDALHQLMLNQLPVDKTLALVLTAEEASAGGVYEQVICDETAVYMKLLDFRSLSLKFMDIFREIEEVASSVDIFMLNFSGKARGDSMKVESLMDFDFQCLEQDHFLDLQDVQFEEGLRCPELSPVQLQQEEIQQQRDQSSSEYEESQDYFEIDDWNRNEKESKGPKTKRKKREGVIKQKREEMVDFKGMPLERTYILLMETEQQYKEKFLNPRDYLMLRFVKYGHPLPRKLKRPTGSKFMPQNTHFQPQHEPLSFEPATFQNPLNETLSWNQATNISRMSQLRFKEAALPIKQMKKRIKEKVVIGQEKRLVFEQIKRTFRGEQPLDIFISVLHIAAEEQAFVVV